MFSSLAESTNGPPYYFAHFGQKIIIWPPPTATEVSGSGAINIYGSLITDAVASIPDEHRMNLLYYNVAMGLIKDEKHAAAAAMLSIYYNSLAYQRVDLLHRSDDTLDDFKPKDRRVPLEPLQTNDF